MATTDTTPITPKQTAFINKLAATRDPAIIPGVLNLLEVDTLEDLTLREASRLIDALKKAPTLTTENTTTPTDPTEEGIYRTPDGTVYKVYRGRNHDTLLAKTLNGTSWEYAGAARRFVTANQRLTLEEAAAYGRETGICIACGRELTDPESVLRGIGPVCASRF